MKPRRTHARIPFTFQLTIRIRAHPSMPRLHRRSSHPFLRPRSGAEERQGRLPSTRHQAVSRPAPIPTRYHCRRPQPAWPAPGGWGDSWWRALEAAGVKSTWQAGPGDGVQSCFVYGVCLAAEGANAVCTEAYGRPGTRPVAAMISSTTALPAADQQFSSRTTVFPDGAEHRPFRTGQQLPGPDQLHHAALAVVPDWIIARVSLTSAWPASATASPNTSIQC